MQSKHPWAEVFQEGHLILLFTHFLGSRKTNETVELTLAFQAPQIINVHGELRDPLCNLPLERMQVQFTSGARRSHRTPTIASGERSLMQAVWISSCTISWFLLSSFYLYVKNKSLRTFVSRATCDFLTHGDSRGTVIAPDTPGGAARRAVTQRQKAPSRHEASEIVAIGS